MILCFYAVRVFHSHVVLIRSIFTNTHVQLWADTSGGGSWMKHAGGVAWLIQRRGPDAYLTDWDKTMLFSFRAMIVGHFSASPGLSLGASPEIYKGRYCAS